MIPDLINLDDESPEEARAKVLGEVRNRLL